METVEHIIGRMEQNLHKAHAADNRFLFGYHAHDQFDQLKALPDPLAGLDAVFGLIERNAEVYYEHHDVPVCPYLESFHGRGLEERLLSSLQRQPTACTVYMLGWLMGDAQHPQHAEFVDTMRRIAGDPQWPPAAAQLAQDCIALHDDRNKVRPVQPANYRVLALDEAIRQFDLETLYLRDGGHDALADTVDSDAHVIVFEGDTEFTENVDIYGTYNKLQKVPSGATGFELLLYGERERDDRVLIVNGNLKARSIGMSHISAFFVLGNVDCEKMAFAQGSPAFIRGDLRATQAILARGSDDDDCALEERGEDYACVQGSAYAPRVQTWFMHLGHLSWREGSGIEFREDVEYEERDHLWMTDPIW